MTKHRWTRIVFGLLAPALIACGDAKPSPSGPTPVTGEGASEPLPTPSGGIVMNGTVSDSAFRRLPGATIEVLDGPHAGLTALTDARGGLSFSGAFDESTRFRATSDGHATSVRTLQPFCGRCRPNWWINFTLPVLNEPVSVAGDYTLHVVAAATCATLPTEARSRTFTATIPAPPVAPPASPWITVPVGGAAFYDDWNTISMGVAGPHVAFWLETLVERVAPNAFIAFAGEARADVGAPGRSPLAFAFNGSIEHCVTAAPNGRYEDCHRERTSSLARCEATHRLMLTRR